MDMSKKIYNPEDFTDMQMEKFADSIEGYLHVLSNIMILPEDLSKNENKELTHPMEQARKLIKKLRKHDRSVFRDED